MVGLYWIQNSLGELLFEFPLLGQEIRFFLPQRKFKLSWKKREKQGGSWLYIGFLCYNPQSNPPFLFRTLKKIILHVRHLSKPNHPRSTIGGMKYDTNPNNAQCFGQIPQNYQQHFTIKFDPPPPPQKRVPCNDPCATPIVYNSSKNKRWQVKVNRVFLQKML